jgi:hypothetical protein
MTPFECFLFSLPLHAPNGQIVVSAHRDNPGCVAEIIWCFVLVATQYQVSVAVTSWETELRPERRQLL